MLQARASTRKIAILYTRLPDSMIEYQQDVLDDVENVSQPLTELGYECVPVAATLNLDALVDRLREIKPVVAFNLVDAIQDFDQLLYMIPSVLECNGIPFTGGNARSCFLGTDKLLAKDMFRMAGISTPAWQRCEMVIPAGICVPLPCIVKPVSSDASRDLDESSVCRTAEDLSAKVNSFSAPQRYQYFAEHFITGREFNISMASMANGVHVFPPAEMRFIDFPKDKPTIVDYRAKWVPESFEFTHTVRHFDFPQSEIPLLEELKSLSLRCWNLFNLSGYARVDFRVDCTGKPYVLEINPNPCISPDAGFVAAAERSGLSYKDLIGAIVEDALRREAVRSGDEEVKAKRKARKRKLDEKK